MTFLHTGLAIAGVAAALIPIVIHLLFRQRRKPVLWGAMRFLLEAAKRTQKRARLEQWLLLATRCLLLVALGMALARPIFSGEAVGALGGGRVVYLLIDNGLASSVILEDGESALAQHRRTAETVLNALGSSDRVGLVTLAKPARAVVSPAAVDVEAIRRVIENLEGSDAATDIAGGLEALRGALEAEGETGVPVAAIVLSEFRAGSAPLERAMTTSFEDLARPVTLAALTPAETTIANVQVTEVEPLRRVLMQDEPGAGNPVTVQVRRFGPLEDGELTTVRLTTADAASTTSETISWEQGQAEATVRLPLRADARRDSLGVVGVRVDGDRLESDNARYFTVRHAGAVRVGLVGAGAFDRRGEIGEYGAGAWLRRALDPTGDGTLEVSEVSPGSLAGGVGEHDVLAVVRPDLVESGGWGALGEFARQGGVVWLMPPGAETVALWADGAESLGTGWQWRREREEAEEGTVFETAARQPRSALLSLLSGELEEISVGVEAMRRLAVEPESVGDEARVLDFADGVPLLCAAPVGRGLVVYQSVSPELEWTNLPATPLMVALCQEIVRQGVSLARRGTEALAGDASARLPEPVRSAVRLEGGEATAVSSGTPIEPLQRAGAYELLDAQGRRVDLAAVNVEPEAGSTVAQGIEAVSTWLGQSGEWRLLDGSGLTGMLSARESGAEASLLLLALAGALALGETVLARWFSHARRDAPEDGGAAA